MRDDGLEARRWLREGRVAALATLSVDDRTRGFPFGSVVPYALDADGAPFILIADIAQHTKNLRADPRASLLICEPERDGDPQAGWRLTLLGPMAPLQTTPERHARYAARVPGTRGYLEDDSHGFRFWSLRTERIRRIGGFGQIGWLEAGAIRRDPGSDEEAEARARRLVEADPTLERDLGRALGPRGEGARLVRVRADGAFLHTADAKRYLFLGFRAELRAGALAEVTPAQVREAL